jgi:hypothetical protein
MRMSLFGASALICIAVTAQAGAVFETGTRDLNVAGKESTTLMRVQDGKLRVEHKDEGTTNVMIFKDDAVHVLDPKDKSYMVIDRATIKQVADQINPALKQMEAQLKNMSPEQRAMVEKMMGNQMPKGQAATPAEVVKTARKDKIGGYNCSYVEVRRGSGVEQELCLTPPATLTGGQEMFDVAKKMSGLMEEMMSAFDSPMLRQNMNQQIDPYSKLDGFPVFSRYYQDGKPSMETTLKSMRSESIAANQFDIPAGYKRKDMMPKR